MGTYYRSSVFGSHTGDLAPVSTVEYEKRPEDTTNLLKRIDQRMSYDYRLPFVTRSRSLSPGRETGTTYVRRARSVSPVKEVVLNVGEDTSKGEDVYTPYYYRSYYSPETYYPYSYYRGYSSPYYSTYSPSYSWGSYYTPYSSYYRRPSYYGYGGYYGGYGGYGYRGARASALLGAGVRDASLDSEVYAYLNRYPTSTSSYYSGSRLGGASEEDEDYYPSYRSRYSYGYYPRSWYYY